MTIRALGALSIVVLAIGGLAVGTTAASAATSTSTPAETSTAAAQAAAAAEQPDPNQSQLIIDSPATGSTVVGISSLSGASDDAFTVEFQGRKALAGQRVRLVAVNATTGETYVAPDVNHDRSGYPGSKADVLDPLAGTIIAPAPDGGWFGLLDVPAGKWSVTAYEESYSSSAGAEALTAASTPVTVTVTAPTGFVPAPTISAPAEAATVAGTAGTSPGFVSVPVKGTGVPGDLIRLHTVVDPVHNGCYFCELYGDVGTYYLVGVSPYPSLVPTSGPGVTVAPDGSWSAVVQVKPSLGAEVYAFQFDPALSLSKSSQIGSTQFTVAGAPASTPTASPSPTTAAAPGADPAVVSGADEGRELAYTGSSPGLSLGIGGLLLAAGGGAMAVGRVRRRAAR